MTHLKRINLLSFLTLCWVSGSCLLTMNSCFSNPDEPVMESPDDTEKPKDPEEDTPSQEAFTLPEGFPEEYALGYVEMPEGTAEQYKEYTSFTLSYNKNNHTANYVSWELLSSETTGSVNRNDYNYWVDKSLEGCTSIDFDYKTYSYERGHMCPAADNRWSGAAMYDCMVIANMVPQLSSLNSGLWGTLENKARDWAKRDKAIWIISGPIYYDTDNLYLGQSKARVPSACFKAFLYYQEGQTPRAIAFVFQNGANPGNLEDYALSIDQLEKETGYDFFPALPDEIEKEIEATYSFSDWNK